MHKPLVAIVLGLALLAGLGLYVFSQQPAEPEAPAAAAPAPASDAAGDPALPYAPRRPDFVLADTEGLPRSAAEWDGHALVVNFWATWCAPCRREMPLLNALQSEYGTQGFQVLGVAMDFREDVLAYLAESPVNYPVMIGEMEAIEAAEGFGVQLLGLPVTAFTDHAGNVVHVHLGEMHREQALLVFDAVLKLRQGEADLDGTRAAIAHGLAQL